MLALLIIVPLICCFSRQRPQWSAAPQRIIQNLTRVRFDPQVFQNEENCAICLEKFQEQDEITPLPCDRRHYFHTQCIIDWLKNNNTCPFCNKPVPAEFQNEIPQNPDAQPPPPVMAQAQVV